MGTHGSHVSNLALLPRRAWQPLQTWRTNYSYKASDSIISLLPKEARGSPATLSPISTREAWMACWTPYPCWSGWARISFIPFASLVTGHPYFPLVSFLTRRPCSSRGSLKPWQPWYTIFASGTRGTPFSRGPLLTSRTNRALPTTLSRKPNATRRAYRTTFTWGAIGPNRTGGTLVSLQTNGPWVARGSLGARKAHGPRGPLLPGGSQGS